MMKIIGAGMPRTGTMSTRAALEHLGYPCYHMESVARNGDHTTRWHQFINGEADMDWLDLYAEYGATVDAPGCFYYKELMAIYPDAKVLLTVREEEGWYKSFLSLPRLINRLRPISRIIPHLRRFVGFVNELHDQHQIPLKVARKEVYLASFRRHNKAVQAYVPADRLLVFDVRQGWEPLCEFLECEVPDIPFPHLNSGQNTLISKMREIFGFGSGV